MSPDKHHGRHAHSLASLYALGALDAGDRAKFESHIEMCRSSVQEVTSLLPVTHRLAAAAPLREAPAAMRDRVLRAISGEAPPAVGAQTNGDAGRDDDSTAIAVAPSTSGSPMTASDNAPDAAFAPAGTSEPDDIAAADAPVAERERAFSVIDDLTMGADVGADAASAARPGMRRAGRVTLWLITIASLGATGWTGWQWMQQVTYTQGLQENLDAANLQAIQSEEATVMAREEVAAVRAQMAILAAPDVETLHLAGQPAAPDASARWITSATAGTLFSAAGLPLPPPGRSYQLWFVANDAPISGGMLPVDETGRIAASVPPPMQNGTGRIPLVAMAVTLEPEDGADAPTGEVYLLGRP